MKRLNGFLYFLSAFIATGSLLLFAMLPLRLYKSVWTGYRVMATPASADIKTYIEAAGQVGISGIVSERSSANRFSFLPLGRYGKVPFTDAERYIHWFRDESGSFRYFYIPYTSLLQFVTFYFTLCSKNVPFYLESALPYSPLKAILALILFFYCIIGSRNKTLFFTAAISFLFYALCVKSNLSLTTALLSIMTTAYWLEALENELAIPWKQLKERIRRNVFMIILPTVPLLTAIIDGLAPFLFFLLALLLSASALFSIYSFLQLKETCQDRYRQHPLLKPFVMHPQSWSRFWNTRYAMTVTVLTGCLLLISAVFLSIFSVNRLGHAVTGINVPQPVSRRPAPFTDEGFFMTQAEQPQGSLPDLSNYIADCWYATVQPYLNVHMPLQPLVQNAQIRFDTFDEDSMGIVHRKEKILYTFDTAFIIRSLRHERLSLLPVEKLLIAQSGFTAVTARPLKPFIPNTLASVFITLCTLLFPCVLIIMTKIQ